jgi:hypothetical protein
MATKTTMGVSSVLGVESSIRFKPALINPECSATPTPNIATNTTPKGAKPVKIMTILDRKSAKESPVNKLFTTTASAVLGSIALKVKFDNMADKTHTTTKQNKKIMAGSGNLFPTLSTLSNARIVQLA